MANTTIPQTIVGKLEFFEEHLPVWAADPASIGIDAADILALSNLVDAARAAYDTAHTSRNAAKADTLTQNIAVGDMYNFGADLVKTIRAFAEKTDDPGVYSAAQIPAPQPPTPAGPPPQPTNLRAELLPGGGLRLRWDGSIAQGAYFSVYRRVEGETAFTLIKSPKDKSYDDNTIPGGVGSVTYYIQAIREQHSVDSGWFLVNFGAGGATVTALGMAA